jgi:hypothetical protein
MTEPLALPTALAPGLAPLLGPGPGPGPLLTLARDTGKGGAVGTRGSALPEVAVFAVGAATAEGRSRLFAGAGRGGDGCRVDEGAGIGDVVPDGATLCSAVDTEGAP